MHLIAHRGLSNIKHTENSVPAILSSLNEDCIDGIECDVRITRDKKLVLIHDPVIDFISDGTGIVKFMNLEELQKFKYGKNKDKIYTLNELLEKINSNKIIIIELKEFGNDFIDLVDIVVNLITQYKQLNIYISSFNYLLINYIKSNYPNIKVGLIIGFGLNLVHLNNRYDFNIVSYHFKKELKNNKQTFLFNIPNNADNLNNDYYLIKDYITCEK